MECTNTIKTKRLCLRRFKEKDVQAVYDIFSDETVNKFLPMFPLKTIEDAEKYLHEHFLDYYKDGTGYRLAICLLENDLPIGFIHVSDDDSYVFGYGLMKEFWHQGIVSEACVAVIDQLKKDGLPYITATHDIHNPNSGGVMRKIGMKYQYTYEELWQPKNIVVNFRMYLLNLDGNEQRVFKKYWDMYDVHYIEEI